MYDYQETVYGEKPELRLTALELAVELNAGGSLTADEVVAEAEIFAAYLAGEVDTEDDAEA